MGRLKETVRVARVIVIQDDAGSRPYQGSSGCAGWRASAEGGRAEGRQG